MTGPRKLPLTAAQRQQVWQARALATAEPEQIAGLGPGNEGAMYAICYGRMKATVTVLLAIIDELAPGGAPWES